MAADPVAAAVIGKAIPASYVLRFDNAEQLLAQADEFLTILAPRLAGRSFHVRLHRQGFKGRIHTPESEQSLENLVVEATSRLDRPARISFSDPEVIVALETVGNQAGLSLWDRKERLKYPFLRLDYSPLPRWRGVVPRPISILREVSICNRQCSSACVTVA